MRVVGGCCRQAGGAGVGGVTTAETGWCHLLTGCRTRRRGGGGGGRGQPCAHRPLRRQGVTWDRWAGGSPCPLTLAMPLLAAALSLLPLRRSVCTWRTLGTPSWGTTCTERQVRTGGARRRGPMLPWCCRAHVAGAERTAECPLVLAVEGIQGQASTWDALQTWVSLGLCLQALKLAGTLCTLPRPLTAHTHAPLLLRSSASQAPGSGGTLCTPPASASRTHAAGSPSPCARRCRPTFCRPCRSWGCSTCVVRSSTGQQLWRQQTGQQQEQQEQERQEEQRARRQEREGCSRGAREHGCRGGRRVTRAAATVALRLLALPALPCCHPLVPPPLRKARPVMCLH